MSKVLKKLYLGDVVKKGTTKQLRKLTTEREMETWVWKSILDLSETVTTQTEFCLRFTSEVNSSSSVVTEFDRIQISSGRLRYRPYIANPGEGSIILYYSVYNAYGDKTWGYETAKTITFPKGTIVTDENGNDITVEFYKLLIANAVKQEGVVGTWLLNSVINPSDKIKQLSDATFNITFTSNNVEYSKMRLAEAVSGWDSNWWLFYDGVIAYSINGDGWHAENYRTVNITGGDDVDNPILEQWLKANATKVEEGNIAGLYDADYNLVASWDTLVNTYGMDCAKDYAYNSSADDHYKNDASSLYSVLKNNSELAKGVNLIVSNKLTRIGSYAFAVCDSLTSITIPDGVTHIGGGAFNNCANIESIVLPDSITSMGDTPFFNLDKLKSLKLPKGLTTIDYCIKDCFHLVSITIPNTVTLIKTRAFWGCADLTTINYMGTVAQWNAMTRYLDWYQACLDLTEIRCSDGVVEPSQNSNK